MGFFNIMEKVEKVLVFIIKLVFTLLEQFFGDYLALIVIVVMLLILVLEDHKQLDYPFMISA